MLVALLGRKGLNAEFDSLSKVGDGFFESIPLRLTAFQFRAPCVEAMLILLNDHARLADHDPSVVLASAKPFEKIGDVADLIREKRPGGWS